MRCELTTCGSSFAMDVTECKSIKDAVAEFATFAEEVGRYGDIRSAEGLICVNGDPAWSLSIGPRGGVRKGAC